MLFQYVAIAILLVLTTAVAVIAISLGALFGPKRETKRKSMPYESGMVPIGKGTRRMPVRFYLIAVLFILFDIEVIFFLPWERLFLSRCWFSLLSCSLAMSMHGRKEPLNGSRRKTCQYGRGDHYT